MKICDLCKRPSITAPVYAAIQQPNECWRDARMDTPYYELDCLRRAVARLRRQEDVLRRIRQWDHLDVAGDGPFWKREIDAVL